MGDVVNRLIFLALRQAQSQVNLDPGQFTHLNLRNYISSSQSRRLFARLRSEFWTPIITIFAIIVAITLAIMYPVFSIPGQSHPPRRGKHAPQPQRFRSSVTSWSTEIP